MKSAYFWLYTFCRPAEHLIHADWITRTQQAPHTSHCCEEKTKPSCSKNIAVQTSTVDRFHWIDMIIHCAFQVPTRPEWSHIQTGPHLRSSNRTENKHLTSRFFAKFGVFICEQTFCFVTISPEKWLHSTVQWKPRVPLHDFTKLHYTSLKRDSAVRGRAPAWACSSFPKTRNPAATHSTHTSGGKRSSRRDNFWNSFQNVFLCA